MTQYSHFLNKTHYSMTQYYHFLRRSHYIHSMNYTITAIAQDLRKPPF